MTGSDAKPSASELAAQLGDSLIDPDQLPSEYLALVNATRDLVAAVVKTDVDADERAAAAEVIAELVTKLDAQRRDPLIFLGRYGDGRVANLTQAGAGRLNPQAPDLTFDSVRPPPNPGSTPEPVEVVGRCTLTEAHSGPPERAHGGVVATLLDETLGVAATTAGATGMTGGINVRYRSATPYGVELEIRARYTHSDGRKHWASGEIMADGVVTASAEAVYIGSA